MTDLQSQEGRSVPLPLISISDHMAESLTVTTNLHTEIVVTTRDKLEIALRKKLPLFLRRKAWVAPLSLLIGLVASIVTSDFHDFMGLSDEVWATIFVIGAVLTFAWLVRALLMLRGAVDLDGVLEAVLETHEVSDRHPLRGAVIEDQ
ncbi:hypothetical protein PP358_gp28 [Arthrobacter phage Shoya]|uniref:Uncharacterized protein n=1 Tax=Arthrobacter phage Shoya TaxID=2704035 RepID=A0A6G6XHV9_9CAUD|nr:hypothetical protein PP358_gp28 [Arthrobacter phage Shoya]QIG57699.1 hypothetical protein SEA_SHOYA_28 [Arthrobacter phage Shoya]